MNTPLSALDRSPCPHCCTPMVNGRCPDPNCAKHWPAREVVTSNERTPTVREALTELVARCREVKAALDAGIPEGEPVHPQSAALTWPLSTAALALSTPPETIAPRSVEGLFTFKHREPGLLAVSPVLGTDKQLTDDELAWAIKCTMESSLYRALVELWERRPAVKSEGEPK